MLTLTPAFIIGDANVVVPSGFAGELFCRFVSSQYFLFTLGKVSVLMIMLLAIERWVAVAKPVKYKATFKRSKMWISIATIFIICFVLNSRALFEKIPVMTSSHEAPKCSWVSLSQNVHFNRSYVIAHSIITFFIPFIVTMVAFMHLYAIIRRQRRTAIESRHSLPVIQLVRMCFVTSVFLGICWIPNQVFFVSTKFGIAKVDTTTHHVTVILSMLNSAANPWIYYATSRKYRRGFWAVLCGCRSNAIGDYSTQMTIHAASRIAQQNAFPEKTPRPSLCPDDTYTNLQGEENCQTLPSHDMCTPFQECSSEEKDLPQKTTRLSVSPSGPDPSLPSIWHCDTVSTYEGFTPFEECPFEETSELDATKRSTPENN